MLLSSEVTATLQLAISILQKVIFFEISVNSDSQNRGHATAILQTLANYSSEMGFELMTNGIRTESANFWLKLLERGYVEERRIFQQAIDYVVIPRADASSLENSS